MEKDFNYILEKIFADNSLSRSEKSALSQVLQEKNLSDAELALLRSKLFDFARQKMANLSAVAILDCVEEINKMVLPEKSPPLAHFSEAYFSPGFSCQKAIIEQIRATRKTLDICVFTISDNDITNEIEHAHYKGVKIRIITDNDKRHDTGSDIFKIEQLGIPIITDSTPDHMHHKFAIFDQKILLFGSYNWTRSAALYNQEDIVVTNEPPLLKSFQEEFDKLWQQFS